MGAGIEWLRDCVESGAEYGTFSGELMKELLSEYTALQAEIETLRAERDALAAALEAAREDSARLDWFDANWFSAYRQCDPIDGLSKHCVLVDESQRSRRGLVADTMRAAIDHARGKGGKEDGDD